MDKNKKAEQFTKDAKIFILSLKDAFKSIEQIACITANREHIFKYNTRFNQIIKNREVLLYKENQTNPISNVNLLSSKSSDSQYVYLLYENAFNIYSKNISSIDKCNHFDDLDKELERLEYKLRKQLKEKAEEVSKVLKIN
jgi:hypothetical protein